MGFERAKDNGDFRLELIEPVFYYTGRGRTGDVAGANLLGIVRSPSLSITSAYSDPKDSANK